MNTLQNKIPDFAVSKEEKGFNELAIILVNKFHLSKLPPNYDYYGVRNNEFEAVSKAGTLWTNNIISPQSAIALLTQPKQLTVEDLKVGMEIKFNSSDCIEYIRGLVYKIEKDEKGFFIQDNVNYKDYNFIFFLEDFILHSSQPEIVPVQEEAKGDETFHEFIYQVVDDTANGKYSTSNAILLIDEAVKKQTAHLQQQLKEAKELIDKLSE